MRRWFRLWRSWTAQSNQDQFVAAPLSPLFFPCSSGSSSVTSGGCFQARAARSLYPRSSCLASASHWLDVAGSSPASHHAAEAFGYLPSLPASSVFWLPLGRSGSRCQQQCGPTRAPSSKRRTLSSNSVGNQRAPMACRSTTAGGSKRAISGPSVLHIENARFPQECRAGLLSKFLSHPSDLQMAALTTRTSPARRSSTRATGTSSASGG